MSAIIDWLSLTFRPAGNPAEFAASFLATVFGYDLASTLEDTGHGSNGYATLLEIPGLVSVAYGGNAGTLHIEFTGSGCAVVRSWDDVAELAEAHAAKITRIDLAHDDFDGTHPISWALEQFATGGFKPPRGTHPNGQHIDDMGSGKGCTLMVGSRESGKLARIYEKGRQLGNPESPWVRYEVEYRATHRKLEYDLIRNPSPYLAGSYVCFDWINKADARRILTVAAVAKASIANAVDHAKKQAGKCLHMMLQLNGGDIGAAFEAIYRPEIPKRCRELYAVAQKLITSHAPPSWWRDSTEAERLRYHRALSAPLLQGV
ncbi:MAG: replication initiation factor domain-containing protein [Pseudomonadota bacterium]